MGKIFLLKEDNLIGGSSTTPLYPVTKAKAVYMSSGRALELVIQSLIDLVSGGEGGSAEATIEYFQNHPEEILKLLTSKSVTYEKLADDVTLILTNLQTAITNNTTSISEETARATENEGTIKSSLLTLITNEVTRATTKENTLETSIENKYEKPVNGIPLSDMVEAVRVLLTTIDEAPTEGSNNLIYSKGVYEAIKAIKGITVDTELSSTSENPVANKVIYEALQTKAESSSLTPITTRLSTAETNIKTLQDSLDIDDTLSTTSEKAVTNKAITTELNKKQSQAVKNTISDTEFTTSIEDLDHEVVYECGTLTKLTISSISANHMEWAIYFTCGDPATELVLPSTYKSVGSMTILANKSYVIFALNGVLILGDVTTTTNA